MRRRNLTVVTGAHVSRISFEEARAERQLQPERTGFKVRAGAEIILAAGAVGSPQILQLSGVGDARYLQSIGIGPFTTRRMSGGTFRTITDQLYFKSKQKTLNDVFGNWPGRMMAGMEYVLRRSGPLSSASTSLAGW